MIRHLRKTEGGRAIHRGAGSIGFIASARTGLLAAWHPKEAGVGVLAVTKSNAATPAESLSYRIRTDDAGRALIEWRGPVELAANDLNHHLEVRCGFATRPRPGWWRSWPRARDRRRPSWRRRPRRASPSGHCGGPRSARIRFAQGPHLKDRSVWYWFDRGADWPKGTPLEKPIPGELPPPIADFIDYVRVVDERERSEGPSPVGFAGGEGGVARGELGVAGSGVGLHPIGTGFKGGSRPPKRGRGDQNVTSHSGRMLRHTPGAVERFCMSQKRKRWAIL